MNPGYVYLVYDYNNDTCKIGVTRDISSKRVKKLQTGNCGELEVLEMYHTDYPFRLEKMLHLEYRNKNVLGEWFALTLNDRRNFRFICKEKEKIIDCMKDNPFFMKNIR